MSNVTELVHYKSNNASLEDDEDDEDDISDNNNNEICNDNEIRKSVIKVNSTDRNFSYKDIYDSGVVFLIDEIFSRVPLRPIGVWLVRYMSEEKIRGYPVLIGYNNPSKIGTLESLEYIQLNANDEYPIFDLKVKLNFPILTILFTQNSTRLYEKLNCDSYIISRIGMKIDDICNKFAACISDLNDRYLIRFTSDTAYNDISQKYKSENNLPAGCPAKRIKDKCDYLIEKQDNEDEYNDLESMVEEDNKDIFDNEFTTVIQPLQGLKYLTKLCELSNNDEDDIPILDFSNSITNIK